jgi:hypothetical protein
MATVAAGHPSVRRARWRPRLHALAATATRAAARLFAPARPAAANLAAVPLHVAGLASIDFAAFHWAHSWGWLVTGVSLMWLEHVIADES